MLANLPRASVLRSLSLSGHVFQERDLPHSMPAERPGGRKILTVVAVCVCLAAAAAGFCLLQPGQSGGEERRRDDGNSVFLHPTEAPSVEPAATAAPVAAAATTGAPVAAASATTTRPLTAAPLLNGTTTTLHVASTSTLAATTTTMEDSDACDGGAEAACDCLMKCDVFGKDTSRCGAGGNHSHNETRHMVDKVISRAMLSHRSMCEGMRCIKECAKSLRCLDRKVKEDCLAVEQNYNEHKEDSDPDCHLACHS